MEQIRLSLPPYLSAESKRALLEQLLRYPQNTNYYGTIPGETEPVQGDAWQGLEFLEFTTAQRQSVVGLIVSNSCDITAENDPDSDQCLLFAPILDMHLFARALRDAGKTEQAIDDTLNGIRKQEIHRLLYLPPGPGIEGESVVPLDRIQSQPLNSINTAKVRRLFTLNQYGWYVLLIKLSIHFTRMQEKLERQPITTPAA